MDSFPVFSGVFDLSWTGLAAVALVFTHITIVTVTVFLHRCQAHRALDLHPLPSHFFRFWLWLTTGMVTKEWAAIHRKHHARCETAEDPHSPQVLGIGKVLWGGAILYTIEARRRETIERWGHGTPDDWIERNLYTRFPNVGITLMGAIDLVLFGVVPGLSVFAVQMLWIPFWAAGVINGIGHYWGYRNWDTEDASRNIVPWGVLIGGEELHNNHHAFPTSAKLSNKWYEFDIGWLYIRCLEALGLARVKKVAPTPRFAEAKEVADSQTLQAVITHRYHVLAGYMRSLRRIYLEELRRLRVLAPQDAALVKKLMHRPSLDETKLPERERRQLAEILARSRALQTVHAMRRELIALWERSSASREQLVKQLQEWCQRAEASGIRPLAEFSRRLRSYA